MKKNKAESKLRIFTFIHFRTWDRYTRRPHFSALSEFADLYVIENPLVLLSKEVLGNFIQSLKFYFKYSSGLRIDPINPVKICRPILFFANELKKKYATLNKIDLFVFMFQIKKYMSDDNIFFLTQRDQKWIITENKKIKFILDMNDEWSMMTYDNNRRPKIEAEIRKLITRVDLTTVVTNKMKEKYSYKDKVFFLPNGVDVRHYNPSFASDTEKVFDTPILDKVDIKFLAKEKNDPRKYKTDLSIFDKFSGPFIGSYSGLSGNWSDFHFVSEVEKMLPPNFTMIASGNVHPPTFAGFKDEYEYYIQNQRMIYLGYVDYAVLPDFLEKLSVGLVMHRADEFNTHSAPNKIWAYLAMGLPVVSTNFLTDVDKDIYEGLVKFANTPQEYVEFIISEYNNDNHNLKMKRRELAVKNSTNARAQKLVDLINKKLLNN